MTLLQIHRRRLKSVLQRARTGDGSGVWHYQYHSMIAVVNVMSTFLASLLPSTSIFILYFLERPIARLVAIMVFTAVFSSTLVLFTKARRVDVFAATTALVSPSSLRSECVLKD